MVVIKPQTHFFNLKWKKVHRYVNFKVDENKEVVVEKTIGPAENCDDFTVVLLGND